MHVYVYFCVAPCSLNSTIKTQPWWKPTDHGEGAVMEARSLPIVPSTPTFACRLPNLRFQRPCALVSVVHHRFGERREKGKKSWMYAAVRFACPRQRRLRNFPLKKLARCIRVTLKIPATVRLTPRCVVEKTRNWFSQVGAGSHPGQKSSATRSGRRLSPGLLSWRVGNFLRQNHCARVPR